MEQFIELPQKSNRGTQADVAAVEAETKPTKNKELVMQLLLSKEFIQFMNLLSKGTRNNLFSLREIVQ